MENKGKSKFIEFRNRDITKLFYLLGFDIRLVGNPEYPNFIMSNSFKLPINVSGNYLVIQSKFDRTGSKVQVELGKGKLNDKHVKDIRGRVIESMMDIEKRDIFKVKCGKLYLHEFKYMKGETRDIKFPVFATCNPKIIYTEDHADDIISKLSKEGYEVEIDKI